MKKGRIESFCLFHLPDPDIPPANERCKDCLANYDHSDPFNNYHCSDFFAYPPIRYEDVRKILDNRGIELNNELEIQAIRRIETSNRAIILKYLAGEYGKLKDGKIKIDYEELTDQLLKSISIFTKRKKVLQLE